MTIGAGADIVRPILENVYKENMTLDNGILLSMYCLSKAVEGQLDTTKIRVAVVSTDDKKLKILSAENIEKYLKMLPSFKDSVEKQ